MASSSLPREHNLNLSQISFPFTFRIGQVMTGVGFGCGVGLGVGRPINFAAFPMGRELMGGAGSLNHSLGAFAQPVRTAIVKLGMKNLDVGIGCGFGVGYGFGVGMALKPGAGAQLMEAAQAITANITHSLHTRLARENPSASPTSSSSSSSTPTSSSASTSSPPSAPTPSLAPLPWLPPPQPPLLGALAPTANPARGGDGGGGTNGQLAAAQGSTGGRPRPTDAEVEQMQVNQQILLAILRQEQEIKELQEEVQEILRDGDGGKKRARRRSKNLSPMRRELEARLEGLGKPCWKCWRKEGERTVVGNAK